MILQVLTFGVQKFLQILQILVIFWRFTWSLYENATAKRKVLKQFEFIAQFLRVWPSRRFTGAVSYAPSTAAIIAPAINAANHSSGFQKNRKCKLKVFSKQSLIISIISKKSKGNAFEK